MNRHVLAALALAALMAGCAAPDALAPAAAKDAAHAATAAAPPIAVFLQPDMSLAEAPPAQDAEVAWDAPAQAPFVVHYPVWKMKLAQDVRLEGNLTARIFLTTNTAAIPANAFPMAADLPGLELRLTSGETTWQGEASGGDVMLQGDVRAMDVTIPIPNATTLPAGAEISLRVTPYYSHVAHAAELRFLMGPAHPAGLGSFRAAH